jgi:recombination protein RecT
MPQQTLRDRAQTRAGGDEPGSDVVRRPKAATLAEQIRTMQDQFSLAMPRGVEAAQLVRDALTCLRTTPKLAECDPRTVLGGLMTFAQLGLRPGVPQLGHGWLIPFKGKAQVVIGYQGLVELAHRSGKISSLIARAVHAHDEFDLQYGLHDNLVHRPRLDGDRGPIVGYYALVKTVQGGHAFVHMSRTEAESHRDRYAMARDRAGNVVGPWRDNFDAMAMKTCVTKLAKFMPKGTDLDTGMAVDNSLRWDATPTIDPVWASHAEALTSGPADGDDVEPGEAVEADHATGEVLEPAVEQDPPDGMSVGLLPDDHGRGDPAPTEDPS